MRMTARAAILAYLAGRSPGCYCEADIAARVTASGRLAHPPASVHCELEHMASPSAGLLVDSDVDGQTGDLVWYATPAGIARWRMDGSAYIP